MEKKKKIVILVKKSLRKFTTNWSFIGERIIMLDINIFNREIAVIGVYAPTNDASLTTMDLLWERISNIIEKNLKK